LPIQGEKGQQFKKEPLGEPRERPKNGEKEKRKRRCLTLKKVTAPFGGARKEGVPSSFLHLDKRRWEKNFGNSGKRGDLEKKEKKGGRMERGISCNFDGTNL